MINNKFGMVVFLIMAIYVFASAEGSPPDILEGKAQIVAYRYKTMLGAAISMYIYDVSAKYASKEILPDEIENTTIDSASARTTLGVPYAEALKIAKSIRNSAFRIGESEILNVDPGIYYFIVTSSDLSKKGYMHQPFGAKDLIYPVVSLSVEAGRCYFLRTDMTYGKGAQLTVATVAEGQHDLKWSKITSSNLNKFSIDKICSEVASGHDSISQMITDYKSYEKMEVQGKKQILLGNVYHFLGLPVGIAVPVILGAIISDNISETKVDQNQYNTVLEYKYNPIPMYIGGAVGTGLGITFLISGINSKKKGKSNVANGRYNKNELQLKIESSCKSISLNLEF